MHSILVPVCEANLTDLVDLGEELMRLAPVYQSPFDREFAMCVGRGGMSNNNFFMRLAMLRNGTYVGFIGGAAQHQLFNPRPVVADETIYVRDGTPFRASIAKQLLGALTTWAFEVKNAAYVRLGETSQINPRGVDAFFRSQGFRKSGTLYNKECKQ
jgi:acetyltransferase (GNAT) family protein